MSDRESMIRSVETIIVSDVHLGSEVSRASELLSVLKAHRFKRLILLGDIFSDLNFKRLKSHHWELLSYIRMLSNPKRKVEIVWVEGNHDTGLSEIMSHLVGIKVYQSYTWHFQGKRFWQFMGTSLIDLLWTTRLSVTLLPRFFFGFKNVILGSNGLAAVWIG